MKRIIVTIGIIVATLMVAQPAWAATSYVDDAIQSLKDSPVYVNSNTEGTDSDTAGILKDTLTSGDNIALVMLPADAATSFEDATALAQAISKGTGDKFIVAVSTGDWFTAYAFNMPVGVAQELMKRAVTVSTNPVETLVTFTRNVHDWQTQHPEAVASPPKGPDNSWVAFPIIGGVLLGGLIGCVVFIVRRARRRVFEDVHNNGPLNLRPYVSALMNRRQRIQNSRMRDAITGVCTHTEAYFSRVRLDKRYNSVAKDTFEQHLQSAEKIVDRYIDFVQNPTFWGETPEVEELKKNAIESIEALSISILKSIRNGSRQIITDFNVDTKILSIQRYR